jgi:broad specificity phosphatase PhoE
VEIVCLRHAESENVLTGASGAVPLAPLTERGRAQAAALAGQVRVGQVRVGQVYASRAVRARQTAEALGSPVTVLPQLAEMSIGRQEGRIDAALRQETADVLHAWVVDGDLDRRVGDGESGREVLERMTAALTRVAAGGGSPAVVGHVGSLTLALSVLSGLGGEVWGAPLPHAVPFVLSWDGTRWHCPQWPA